MNSFVYVWIAYAIVGTTLFSLAFAWAVRARQFSDLERGKFIALDSAESIEEHRPVGRPSVPDRYAWLVLFLILAVAATLVLRLAARGS